MRDGTVLAALAALAAAAAASAADGVFSIVLLVLAALLIDRLARPGAHAHPALRSSALDVLEERYARVEIQREERLQKRSDLRGGG